MILDLAKIRDEMKKRGCTKAQMESRSLGIILDIIAETDVYKKMIDVEQELNVLESRKADAERTIDFRWRELRKAQSDFEATKREYNAYIEDFNKHLENCATDVARDRLRIAQTFINTANIATGYDNTAFIIGLASILSQGGMNPVDEFKKINPVAARSKEFETWAERI